MHQQWSQGVNRKVCRGQGSCIDSEQKSAEAQKKGKLLGAGTWDRHRPNSNRQGCSIHIYVMSAEAQKLMIHIFTR